MLMIELSNRGAVCRDCRKLRCIASRSTRYCGFSFSGTGTGTGTRYRTRKVKRRHHLSGDAHPPAIRQMWYRHRMIRAASVCFSCASLQSSQAGSNLLLPATATISRATNRNAIGRVLC